MRKLTLLLVFIFKFVQYLTAQSCDCNKYLYLNDTGLDYVEKFSVDAQTGALTEIGDAQNGMPWLNAAGIVDDPHGIATDLNGNIYIGENDMINGEYNIQKFNCVGEKLDADLSTPIIDNFIEEGFSFNHFSVGNYIYVNIFSDFETGTGDIKIFDLCTGEEAGCIREGYFWGFAAGTDGYWYATGTGSPGNFTQGIYKGLLDPSAFTDSNGGCGTFELLVAESTLGVPVGSRIMGVVQDPAGNLYAAVSAGFGFNPPSYIVKLDANGNIITQSLTDNQFDANPGDNLNWAGSRGIVYNNGYLYVSSGDDCIAVFESTNLTYQPALSNNIIASFPKQIGLLTECCPTVDDVVIDTLFCNIPASSVFYLQDIINCDGPACEGLWTVTTNDPNVTYNNCDNSIVVEIDSETCSSYTFSSDGTANFANCGAFSITVNFETAQISEAVIGTDQTICVGGTAQPLTAISPTPGVSFQWQSNTTGCDGNFTDIPNATEDTYTPSGLPQNTYYRVNTTLPGNCFNGNCTVSSNCVTIETEVVEPRCIREFGEFTIQKNRP